jgi:hypothetical protein
VTTRAYSPSGLHRGEKPVTDWPTIRMWVIERDGHVCQTCELRQATEVDHVWPRRLGGEDHIDNLKAICGPCNKTKGARVDLASAAECRLGDAARVLRNRIADLEAELREVEREQMGRLIARGDFGGLRRAALAIEHQHKVGANYVETWHHVAERVAAEEQRPLAEVIPFPGRGDPEAA